MPCATQNELNGEDADKILAFKPLCVAEVSNMGCTAEVITKEIVKEVPSVKVKEFTVSDLVFVTFAQGKSALTKEAKAALNNVKEGVHVQVVGTASPEGSKELNDRLSQLVLT